MFSDRLIYPYYATAPRVAGITPLNDQIMAGAIMWVPGSLFYLIPGALIMFRILAPRTLSQPLAPVRAFRNNSVTDLPVTDLAARPRA